MKHLIYVTEDDENIRNLICVALESFGYQTRSFETAEEALEAVKEAQGDLPSLFVFDWMLPGMDGMAAVGKLKAAAETKKIPVMMLTAKDSELDVVAGLDGGADDYMTKPFGILEFSARIRNLLKRFSDDKQEGKKPVCGRYFHRSGETGGQDARPGGGAHPEGIRASLLSDGKYQQSCDKGGAPRSNLGL